MKKKKPNDLQVLLGYAGKHQGLTFLGLGLSAVAMVLGMLPYICIWVPCFVLSNLGNNSAMSSCS